MQMNLPIGGVAQLNESEMSRLEDVAKVIDPMGLENRQLSFSDLFPCYKDILGKEGRQCIRNNRKQIESHLIRKMIT